MTLRPFYFGFDGLDVTFQGRIPPALVVLLDETKAASLEAKGKQVLVVWRGESFHVGPSGAKGGYAFCCDTGPTGATWWFSRNQKNTNWNIRVSVKSDALASMGLGGVRAELYRFLEAIGANVGKASISRVDYCMDFLADDIAAATGEEFALEPRNFVMHARTGRSDEDDDAGMKMKGVSGRYTSVTCGSMPGRQVIVYDKSREIRVHQKPQWWAHWNAARERQGLAPMEGDERVWRVELRAGKRYLKDRWGIGTWQELDAKIGDLFRRALEDIRYAVPNPHDPERWRWESHDMWAAAHHWCVCDLFEMATGATPGVVKRVKREQLAQCMRAMILGLVATWTLATGTPATAEEVAPVMCEMTANYLHNEPQEFAESMKRAASKYHFVCEEGENGGTDCQVSCDLGGSGEGAVAAYRQGLGGGALDARHGDRFAQPDA